MNVSIKITLEKLSELRMLADWQLKEMGFDPQSVTTAVLEQGEEYWAALTLLRNRGIQVASGKAPNETEDMEPTLLAQGEIYVTQETCDRIGEAELIRINRGSDTMAAIEPKIVYVYNENCVMAGKSVPMRKLENYEDPADGGDWHTEELSEENVLRLENSKSAYERKIARTIREIL